jgi:hypothetical protein
MAAQSRSSGSDPSLQLNRAFLQIKPQISLDLQPGSSTSGKSLQLGPVFFSLARKLKILHRIVLKFVLAIT